MDECRLCQRCELLTLDTLGQEHGHLLYHHVASLRDEANREGACNICSLIWWSVRQDRYSIRQDDEMPVRLFLNPPPSKTREKIHRVDIIITSKDVTQFMWLPELSGEPWHLGPPDYYRRDLGRCHLTLYGSYSTHIPSPIRFEHPLIEC